jgi:serine/threonine protein kinase
VWLEGCKFSDFKLGPILGTGSFGRVHLAHYIPTNQVCASKSLSKAMIVKSKQASYILSNQLGNLLPFSFVEIMRCNVFYSFLTRNDIGFLSFHHTICLEGSFLLQLMSLFSERMFCAH